MIFLQIAPIIILLVLIPVTAAGTTCTSAHTCYYINTTASCNFGAQCYGINSNLTCDTGANCYNYGSRGSVDCDVDAGKPCANISGNELFDENACIWENGKIVCNPIKH